MALGTALGKAYTQIATAPDYSLRIGPLRFELAPRKVIETFGYNGTYRVRCCVFAKAAKSVSISATTRT